MARFLALVLILGLFIPSSGFCTGDLVVNKSTRNKILNDYALLTRDVIQKNWNTPVELFGDGALKGKVVVNYTIRKDGTLEKAELIRGSGNGQMDKSLMKAIKTAGKFPRFPESVDAKRILIKANFIVADIPNVPVVAANHEIARPVESQPGPAKKYIWGQPAGTGSMSIQPADEPESNDENVPRPEAKKYKWGLD